MTEAQRIDLDRRTRQEKYHEAVLQDRADARLFKLLPFLPLVGAIAAYFAAGYFL